MTTILRELLDAFDALPDADKHQATVEILRRVAGKDSDLPDITLVEAADELFRTLDEAEASHASG